MTAVLRSPQQFPSSPSSPLSCSSNHALHPLLTLSPSCGEDRVEEEIKRESGGRGREGGRESGSEEVEELSVLAVVLTVLRKARCRTEGEEEDGRMEISWPTDVRHVAHVTFDRFHGFLGLPVEFEPEVPRRAPSASAKVFGVSTDSMQCSYDCRGNSVPTILLLMQRSLYEQGGLRAEGIFRINAENSQEEFVRNQLNSGVVPEGVDVHCLAGLIKAWFRELPSGVLDPLSPEQVMQCQTEEECGRLTKDLPLTEASLLDWAVNLMADVVQEEDENKMNARNVALVFAPNMTQMADPLTALMYAVQVMNFLMMLILKTLKERRDSVLEDPQTSHSDPNGGNDDQRPDLPLEVQSDNKLEDQIVDNLSCLPEENSEKDEVVDLQEFVEQGEDHTAKSGAADIVTEVQKKPTLKFRKQSTVKSSISSEMSKGTSIVSCINSKPERVEAWR